jgi:2-phospho-L-lactate guanylyltransferase
MRPCAVVPVKRFDEAKQRLSACCDAPLRRALARAMLEDVLDVLGAAPGLAGVLIVTGDAEAAQLARRRGMGVLDEPRPGGLNAAVGAAARRLSGTGCCAMLVVPADAPGVSADEIGLLVDSCAAGHGVTIVPAHDRSGTNALLLGPPGAMAPAFGDDSFRRHLLGARVACLTPRVVELPGLGLDLDHPRDLVRYASTPSNTRTWRLIADAGLDGPAPPTRARSALATTSP